MQITVLNVSVEDVKTAKGGYQKMDVAYKDEQGKTQGKKIMSFVNQKVFDVLKQSSQGDVFNISSEKDDNGYWQWIGIEASTDAVKQPAKVAEKANTGANMSPKSTYETPEERAKKQVFIVRQSSLTAALTYLNAPLTGNHSYEVADVINVAKQFEQYVFGQEEQEIV